LTYRDVNIKEMSSEAEKIIKIIDQGYINALTEVLKTIMKHEDEHRIKKKGEP